MLLFLHSSALASDFGTVGLLDMPSARMRADGIFSVQTVQQDTVDMYSLTYQATPWLETTFRYAVFNPGERDAVLDDLRDRSFGVKARLLKEGRLRPAVAIGLRDAFGTGVWSGEYVVASKRFGNLDLTLGAGWGRFADRAKAENPLGRLDDRFRDRDGFQEGDQGLPLRGTFFQGPDIGFFGGASWTLPRWDVDLVAEYSSDRYVREIRLRHFDQTDPINFGIRWRPVQGVQLTASRQLGQDFAFSISADLDTLSDVARKPRKAFFGSGEPRSISGTSGNIDLSRWYDRLLYDVERSGLLLLSADTSNGGRTVWLEIENVEHAYAADAIERVLAFAEVHLPARVTTIHVILQNDEIVEATIAYDRQLGRTPEGVDPFARDAIRILPTRRMIPDPRYTTKFRIPNFSTSVSLGTRFQLMDPQDPLRYQFSADVGIAGDLGRGFFVRGAVGIDIYNDFDDIDRPSNSTLPRVRSDVVRYLQEGETGIASLYLEKRGMASDSVAYRGYAGILEDQYSGVGGEVLWRPFGSRFAFGVNANFVAQRDFDRRFGLRDFETVTAHASAYWATPFHNFDFAVHAGRFLARDLGATFELRRTFDNGWMIGLFATLTDVPFDEFGEGSFDRGMFFRIPFNSLLTGNTRSSYSTSLRLLQRDGGQRLEDFGTTLWWDARSTRTDSLVRTSRRMLPL